MKSRNAKRENQRKGWFWSKWYHKVYAARKWHIKRYSAALLFERAMRTGHQA